MPELKTDHWVKTADGSIGRVRYVHERDQTADVAVDNDWDQTITLPLTELRRIADPAERRPPIEGMPAPGDRPGCGFCGRLLKPRVRNVYHDVQVTAKNSMAPRVKARIFEGWETRSRVFCTHGCAGRFAIAAWEAGYRIVKGGVK